jgi:hypothetical protein
MFRAALIHLAGPGFGRAACLSFASRTLSADPADSRQVLAVGADAFTALAAGGTCFVPGEFVGRPFNVGGLSPFARDLALLVRVHRSETSVCRSSTLHV